MSDQIKDVRDMIAGLTFEGREFVPAEAMTHLRALLEILKHSEDGDGYCLDCDAHVTGGAKHAPDCRHAAARAFLEAHQ